MAFGIHTASVGTEAPEDFWKAMAFATLTQGQPSITGTLVPQEGSQTALLAWVPSGPWDARTILRPWRAAGAHYSCERAPSWESRRSRASSGPE